MSQKYEKPQLIPFSSDRYETAEGANCGVGGNANPQCRNGTVASGRCNTGATASTCALGSAG